MHGPMHGRTGTATYTGDWIHGKIKVGVIKIAGLSSADFTYSNNCRQMSVSLIALTAVRCLFHLIVVNQTNHRTASKATLRKLLRD